jgi:SAM-dependent methyltransferase
MSDRQSEYEKDAVRYLGRITELFGGYKQRSFEFLNLAPGLSALDVGCGAGDDLAALARVLGPEGRAVGVDASEDMLAAARKKTAGAPGAVEVLAADAASLPFEDHSFDRARADRVFQHVPDPSAALGEMIRVLRPGGWLTVLDVDWHSLLIDAADLENTSRLVSFASQSVPHPAVGRRLYGLFRRAGLEGVDAYAETVCVREWPVARVIWGLDVLACKAADAGALTPSETEDWMADLEARDADGAFFAAITGFVVRGRKPKTA